MNTTLLVPDRRGAVSGSLPEGPGRVEHPGTPGEVPAGARPTLHSQLARLEAAPVRKPRSFVDVLGCLF